MNFPAWTLHGCPYRKGKGPIKFSLLRGNSYGIMVRNGQERTLAHIWPALMAEGTFEKHYTLAGPHQINLFSDDMTGQAGILASNILIYMSKFQAP